MAYRYSNDDRKNLSWFKKDHSRQSLRKIKLVSGELRGLKKFKVTLDFPITAIAGANGSGKSTFLALAACAFHNKKSGFKTPEQKNTYYTFSDFFVQSKSEMPPQGILIEYAISHDSWHNSKPCVGLQVRRKSVGGKWNNYDTRVRRNVAYFGVQRVVPHFERSAHKNYRARFESVALDDQVKTDICQIASRIIGKQYDDFEQFKHSKYSLPQVASNGVKYSGFNMGAGESAVFEILAILFSIGSGALLVIDEIELGLHERAQYRLIKELKKLCLKFKCQIICSTHSFAVLSSLPPEGRLFVETGESRTDIIAGISADFACGKMGGANSKELDAFVEDGLSQSIVQGVLPSSVRKRVNIVPVGSHSAVVRQLASRYLESKNNCLAILDGDQKPSLETALKEFVNYTEASDAESKEKAKDWARGRLQYLPSEKAPEVWLLEALQEKIEEDQEASGELVECWDLEDASELKRCIQEACNAERHSEFHCLAEEASIDEATALRDVIRSVKKFSPNEITGMLTYFEAALIDQ